MSPEQMSPEQGFGKSRTGSQVPLVIFDRNGEVLYGADTLAVQVALNVAVNYQIITGIDPDICPADLAELVAKRNVSEA